MKQNESKVAIASALAFIILEEKALLCYLRKDPLFFSFPKKYLVVYKISLVIVVTYIHSFH